MHAAVWIQVYYLDFHALYHESIISLFIIIGAVSVVVITLYARKYILASIVQQFAYSLIVQIFHHFAIATNVGEIVLVFTSFDQIIFDDFCMKMCFWLLVKV